MRVYPEVALRNLVLDAELAGAAMACRYSCSNEYEAALIAERRDNGVYDVPPHRHAAFWIAGALMLFLSFALI
jgi:hypothetical protein